MDLQQALRSTGAVREFDDRPVPDEVVYRILDTARYAPSGGNRQAWRLIHVKDKATRERLRDCYVDGWYQYVAMGQGGLVPWAPVTDRAAEASALESAPALKTAARQNPGGFADEFDRVPVMLVLLANLRALAAVDRDLDRYTLVGGASIYPFAWSVLLAAHDEDLGGVITTMVVSDEASALQLLEVPDGWAIAATLALGYPKGKRATKLKRSPVEAFTAVDRFDGPPFTEPGRS